MSGTVGRLAGGVKREVRALSTSRTASSRVRLYETVRTAHLERARELAPASIVYRRRRYDFDPRVAAGLDLIEAGPVAAAVVLARSDVRELEINEPLMVSSLRRTALALAAVTVAGWVRRRRTVVVTYAIANDDPFRPPRRPGALGAVRRRLDAALIRVVAGRVDRIAYGTEASRDLYARLVPAMRAVATSIPALPTVCTCGPEHDGAPGAVLFVGAFEPRKGVLDLLAAWPEVARQRPHARLTLVGKGPQQAAVEELVAGRADVTLVVDPPRSRVHELQREHSVAVLLSRRTPTWREQVGLPVVEGLAHGCSVLTTTETGLASWLAGHGHAVVDPDSSATEVAAQIVRLLDDGRSAASVLADLPVRDGRLEADTWLFGASPV